jgi:hypothetical protein
MGGLRGGAAAHNQPKRDGGVGGWGVCGGGGAAAHNQPKRDGGVGVGRGRGVVPTVRRTRSSVAAYRPTCSGHPVQRCSSGAAW